MNEPIDFQRADEDTTNEVSAAVNRLLDALNVEMAMAKSGRTMPATFMAACSSVLAAVVAVRVSAVQTSFSNVTPEIVLRTISDMAVANLPEAKRISGTVKAPTNPGTETRQ